LIKFLVKLAVAGLIANATWRVGGAYMTHYKFQDAIREAAQFRGRKTDDELRQRIVELAADFEVPITGDDLTLQNEASHFLVDGRYVRTVELVPGYTYPWPFTVHTDVFVDGPQKPGDVLRIK
jgi:hypothetical protein